ncbi:peptidoglycan synthetase [Paludibacter sp. 221]|uniref:UDP-N-acetylmuramate--L-alanine ligase n=1 Tax=Paludibacter sp. 221 TaxID=2302939 RepID=UPI0013D37F7B|nr:Mur ligase family protein [Paludibacter sp. 221]NDV46799.1 peptidoglycan synthetase [Paludibacter sp. 221]
MPKIHFIAIGGAAMHSMAIALSKNPGLKITGSDDEIFEPSRSRLEQHNLLPAEMGWFPERIHEKLDAVIVGMHATEDNPELQRAKELGLRIYSFPEYLYENTRGKTRIVIGGSHGKTTTTAMILFVLNKLKINADYMVGAQIEGLDNTVKLSYDAKIAIFEGDEYLTSPLDKRPKFHLYKPHIAVLTGIAWDHINVFPTFDNYVEQFSKFVNLIEHQGRLIYYADDKNLQTIAENSRRDIITFPYNTPKYEVRNGITYLQVKNGEIPLKIFGEHNLQNMEAARLVCRQLGIWDDKFYPAIAEFTGASNRLQKIYETENSVAYKDFAHSPSKLKATVEAVKNQYPDKKLVACMELHTFSSLREDFLPQYKDCMAEADVAYVYFNPEVVKHKRLKEITAEQVKEAFGGNNLTVFTNSEILQNKLRETDLNNTALLFMTSGNFSGINLIDFAKDLLE